MKKKRMQLLAAMLIFGSIGLFVKAIPLPSPIIVLARTVIGSLFLLIVLLARRRPVDKARLKKNWLRLLISGAVLGFNWMFLFEAYRYTSVSAATLAYYCAPLLVFLASPLLFREQLTVSKVLGIAAAAGGMLLMGGTTLSGSDPARGITCGFLAALLYAALMLLNKTIKDVDGLETTLVQLLVAAAVMGGYAALTQSGPLGAPGPVGIVSLIVVGVAHTGVACWLYFSSMQGLPGQTIALCSYVDPSSALLFSALFLGERLTAVQWLGALLILGGAAAGQLIPSKKIR